MKSLVLNSGSSSQKACLYEIGDAIPASPPLPLWEGRIECISVAVLCDDIREFLRL
jgi:acetate kinase